MNILDFLHNNILILDGGMGSLLQEKGLKAGTHPSEWNLSHPDIIAEIHRDYFDAGSNLVYTNTFGISSLMYDKEKLDAIVGAAIENARKGAALSSSTSEKFVALDIGPTGRLLKPYGDMEFEDAVSVFADMVRIGCRYDPDCIVLETLNDIYETKAALLAVKENCSLPVFVTNSYGMDGKLMTGADPAAVVALLEGMGADAIGVNCSLGPKELEPVVQDYLKLSRLPIILKPNAGIPYVEDGKTIYDLSAGAFAAQCAALIKQGVAAVGGCCGTRPQFIKELCEKLRSCGCTLQHRKVEERTVAASYTHAVTFGGKTLIIGERINPTGKKKFRQALYDHNIAYVLDEGIRQADQGADALDVNVGIPDIYEPELLTELVRELQTILDIPLQIDTSDAVAMERALRIYNGKAIINSVNGEQESMDRVFPLAAKYGGVVVALTLDENGVPATVDGRMEIARRILREATEYGIGKRDIVFDALTMTISADVGAGNVTLETVRRIKEELGCHTVLGVSNVSFGLPRRDILNSTFLRIAEENGLDAAIFNPGADRSLYEEAAVKVLTGRDEGCAGYIAFAEGTLIQSSDAAGATAAEAADVTGIADTAAANVTGTADTAAANVTGTVTANTAGTSAAKVSDTAAMPVSDMNNGTEGAQGDCAQQLKKLVTKGLKAQAVELVRELIKNTDPLEIINTMIIPALNDVGARFESGKLYLPQLMISAETAGAVFEIVKTGFARCSTKGFKVIMATVKGDVHDIGKNICKLLLESYGFEVIDLGKDVSKETILAAIDDDVKVVGLSALMTTTLPAMEETVAYIKDNTSGVLIAVGGAVLTEEYAERIGADIYTADALSLVQCLQKL